MDGVAAQCVEICGKRSDEGLAFAGAHLGDFAFVKDDAADHLYVEVAHAEDARGCFTYGGEGFREDVVEGFAAAEAGLELVGQCSEVIVHQTAHRVFVCVDVVDDRLEQFELLLVGIAY